MENEKWRGGTGTTNGCKKGRGEETKGSQYIVRVFLEHSKRHLVDRWDTKDSTTWQEGLEEGRGYENFQDSRTSNGRKLIPDSWSLVSDPWFSSSGGSKKWNSSIYWFLCLLGLLFSFSLSGVLSCHLLVLTTSCFFLPFSPLPNSTSCNSFSARRSLIPSDALLLRFLAAIALIDDSVSARRSSRASGSHLIKFSHLPLPFLSTIKSKKNIHGKKKKKKETETWDRYTCTYLIVPMRASTKNLYSSLGACCLALQTLE